MLISNWLYFYMIEYLNIIVPLSLVALIAFREIQHEKHIKRLEDKIIKTDSKAGWAGTEESYKKIKSPNEMAREDGEETPIADIPMMEFTDRDFNIQMEGDSETPQEAVARKQR